VGQFCVLDLNAPRQLHGLRRGLDRLNLALALRVWVNAADLLGLARSVALNPNFVLSRQTR